MSGKVNPNDTFRYIRITDTKGDYSGTTPGADIDAVGVKISGSLMPSDPPPPPLDEPSDWAKEDVYRARDLGLLPSLLNSKFQENITRAEFCDLAVPFYENLTGKKLPPYDPHTSPVVFIDSANPNVINMQRLGVVAGKEPAKFFPNDPITRQEAAVFLDRFMRALGYTTAEFSPTFDDTQLIPIFPITRNENAGAWALGYIGKMQSSKIMSGVGNNRFDPHGNYTREQSIVVFMRIRSLLRDFPHPSVKDNDKLLKETEYKTIFSDSDLYNAPNNLYWRLAYWAALASQDTYEPDYLKSDKAMLEMGFKVDKENSVVIFNESDTSNDEGIEVGEIKAVYGIKKLDNPINNKKNIIMISFRGTIGTRFVSKNWRTNILGAAPSAWYNQPIERAEYIKRYKITAGFGLISPYSTNPYYNVKDLPQLNSDLYYSVHGGFFRYVNHFITHDLDINEDNKYFNYGNDKNESYPIEDCLFIVVGHSLGGAMAELYSLRLSEYHGVSKNDIICYGIASPPVGNKKLAEYSINEQKMGDRIYKLCHEDDIVPYAGIDAYTLASSVKEFKDSDIKTYYLVNGNRHYIKDTYLPYILPNIE